MATKKAFVSGHNYIQDIHMEAGIYTVLMKVKSMYGDVWSFALFDGTTWTHYDMDTVQGQWKWAYVTFRTLVPVSKINLISRNYSAELPVYVVEPQIVAGNIPFDAGVAPADLNKESNELQSTLQSMDSYIEGAFKDGLIESSEAKAIEKYLNTLHERKVSVDASYTQLHGNSFLEGAPKTNLENAKTALNTAYTNLIDSINGAIYDGKTTQLEKDDVDAKFGLFSTSLAAYQVRSEEANKAIQNKLKSFSDEAEAKAQALEYLKLAIDQDAEIDGALVTLVTMLLKQDMNADVTAGISGIQGAAKDEPAFWAGGTYDQARGGTAEVIIRHDGSGHLAGGDISWDEEGNSLFTGSIQSSDEGNRIVIDAGDRSLKMINKYDKQLVNFHFYEDTGGSYPVLRMDSWFRDALGDWSSDYFADYSPFGIDFRSWHDSRPWVGQLNSYGMSISYGWQGTNSERSILIGLFDDQYLEMRMKGSVISNLSLKPKVILGSDSVWLDHWDVFVTCYNSANINVYLPSSPSLGAIKFIRRMNASNVTVMGNGEQISHGNGSLSSSISAGNGRGDTAVLFWDGQYWTYNYWVRDT